MNIDSNTSIFLGQTEIVEIKIGNTTIWQKNTTPVVEPDYFYVENNSGETDNLVVKVIHNDEENNISSSSYTHSIEYSKDKTNWTTLDTSSETEYQISFDDGDKVYFRNDTGVFNCQIGGPCHTIRFNTENITYSAGGDIRTLLDYTDVDNITMSEGCFANLFSGYNHYDEGTGEEYTVEGRCDDASDLTLPSSVAPLCYYQMFWNCTSLTTAPSLPATTLAEDCYNEMFSQCYSLATAPSLPATTLTTRCYSGMFSNCGSLTTAPTLPATTLEEACYSSMFAGCTSLTTAPSLPATTLANYCYGNMFENCSAITTPPTLPATTLKNGCYYWMFNGCYSLTTAPSLPATTLADNCYGYMFSYCSAITSAPSLPATTLAYSCYQGMFAGTGITTAPSLPATDLEQYCYANMFSECYSLTTAPSLPATTLKNGCYSGMFNNCTSLTTAPELPATKLAQGCYQQMFSYCTALTTPPAILPATDLTNCESCYNEMFSNCESLTSVPILPATTLSGGCYMDMFRNCTSLTAGPALPATTLAENCYANMFFSCTNIQSVITYADDITADGCTSNWLGGEDVWDDEQQMDVSTAPPSGTIYNGGSAPYLVNDYSGIPVGWSEASVPAITSVGSVPSTFTAKSWMDKARVSYTIVGHNTTGIDVPLSNVTEKVNIGVNTGNTSLTYTESKTYDNMSFSYTITQSANDPYPDYFWVESTNGYATVNVYGNSNGSPSTNLYTPTIEYSTDRITWTSVTLSTGMNSMSPVIGVGQKMYFRNDTGVFSCYEAYNSYFKYSITATNKINVGGSVNTLLDYFVTSPSMPKGCFNRLFNASGSQNIISASSLVLPNKTSEFCYEDMFYNCSNLTAAPTLPATKLEQYCYEEMFNGCTSLTTAPSLPATDLGVSCYSSMFKGCTSLTTAPSLPATTLPNYCYQMMFNGCSSLTTAPSLPALVLSPQCYSGMFANCSSLVNPPSLPATTLASNCYESMFGYCTSLTTAPSLPATDLTNSNYCYQGMFKACYLLTTAPSLPATTLSEGCYNGMFDSCIALTTPPSLPATTLSNYCYQLMFNGCTSLTTAPSLPATTLKMNCYRYMFMNCSSLNTVITYANNISASNSHYSWLSGVASTGTFYKLGTASWPSGGNGIPSGWTVETTPPN